MGWFSFFQPSFDIKFKWEESVSLTNACMRRSYAVIHTHSYALRAHTPSKNHSSNTFHQNLYGRYSFSFICIVFHCIIAEKTRRWWRRIIMFNVPYYNNFYIEYTFSEADWPNRLTMYTHKRLTTQTQKEMKKQIPFATARQKGEQSYEAIAINLSVHLLKANYFNNNERWWSTFGLNGTGSIFFFIIFFLSKSILSSVDFEWRVRILTLSEFNDMTNTLWKWFIIQSLYYYDERRK